MRAQVLALDPALAVDIKQEIMNGQPVSRVLVSQLDTWLAAETVRRRLQSWGVTGVVRQLPAEATLAVAGAATAAPL
jgi:rare lipoprotein A